MGLTVQKDIFGLKKEKVNIKTKLHYPAIVNISWAQ